MSQYSVTHIPEKKILKILGCCAAPPPTPSPSPGKPHSYRRSHPSSPAIVPRPQHDRYLLSDHICIYSVLSFPYMYSPFTSTYPTHIICHTVMSICHVIVSYHLCHLVMCHTVMSSCHTYITILIRIHMDNIYVNKLTTQL